MICYWAAILPFSEDGFSFPLPAPPCQPPLLDFSTLPPHPSIPAQPPIPSSRPHQILRDNQSVSSIFLATVIGPGLKTWHQPIRVNLGKYMGQGGRSFFLVDLLCEEANLALPPPLDLGSPVQDPPCYLRETESMSWGRDRGRWRRKSRLLPEQGVQCRICPFYLSSLVYW